MVTDTWQPNGVGVSMTSSDHSAVNPKGIVSAQVSDDGGTVVVRCVWLEDPLCAFLESLGLGCSYVNSRPEAITLQVEVKGAKAAPSAGGTMWLLHSPELSDSNTPSEPTYVSPKASKIGDLGRGVPVPGNSFVVLELGKAAAGVQ